ncbi:hypothetical protein MPSEU_000062300 [Mayamaea pseudoterrestris]|nr:hypothetical protein MPSEU_000062300 [Mayamaea pseudoterrestris]
MKLTILLTLLAASAQATPVLRGLKTVKACNADCTATFTTCTRAPGADKKVCMLDKTTCQATCAKGRALVEDEEEVETPKSICISNCAKSKNACMKTAKGKDKNKLCMPGFKECKAGC